VRQVVEAAGPRNVRNLASGLDGILKHADAEALQEYTRERVPLEWAMTQNNLGNALRTLGGSRWRSRNTTTAPRRVLLSDVDERALGF
jgi:2-polyprenyl-6-methoxyphenol hydroxylase-like FAD-dependent oxidoreductase